MTGMSEMEGVEAPAEPLTTRRHSRIPGVDAMRATSGFQRGMLVFGAAIVAFFVVMAILAPFVAPYGFNDDRADGVVFGRLKAPSAEHWFGTTHGGEDVFSQVLFGAQTALEVIILAVLISIVVGVPAGLISGYFGGWLDRVLVLVSDALFAFPPLLLAIIISVTVSGGRALARPASWLRRSRSPSSTSRSTSGSFATRPWLRGRRLMSKLPEPSAPHRGW